MKRWSMDAYCMLEDPDGEWVRHEDAEKLKELNREMYEALEAVDKSFKHNYPQDQSIDFDASLKVLGALQKARGEGE